MTLSSGEIPISFILKKNVKREIIIDTRIFSRSKNKVRIAVILTSRSQNVQCLHCARQP